ncbi:hypothetical protein AVEN_195662-1 [Araneus ventricosus]|uniref:Uncharacterized protein n=1 Tax=Araneus ventricosus TaxID=182803 RepID=A0A4Y2B9H1_ARAVE|nr:hypothetical protein AVEN_195662-1 [Araneus ventricosus]
MSTFFKFGLFPKMVWLYFDPAILNRGEILGLFVYLLLIKMPPKRQNIGRHTNAAIRENGKKDKTKQKKKQHNEMKEMDYIGHSRIRLNHHNNTK